MQMPKEEKFKFIAVHEMGHAIISYMHGVYSGVAQIDIGKDFFKGYIISHLDIVDNKKIDANNLDDIFRNMQKYIKDIYLKNPEKLKRELVKLMEVALAGTITTSVLLGDPGEKIEEDWLHYLVFLHEYMACFSEENITDEEYHDFVTISRGSKSREDAIKIFGGRILCVLSEPSVEKFIKESSDCLAKNHTIDYDVFLDFLSSAGVDAESIRNKCF